MNKDEQIKALAELGGYTERKGVMEYDGAYMPWTIMERDGNEYNSTDKRFDYLTSHDAIILVIEKQPYDVQYEMVKILIDYEWNQEIAINDCVKLLTSAPQQLSESLLRATGKWKE